jgi:hypothetical protein
MSGGASSAGIKVDGGIPLDLARLPAVAAGLEPRRYDGCWTGEINHDPFLPMLAAEHTSKLPTDVVATILEQLRPAERFSHG